MNIVLVYLIRYFVCATGRIARRPIDERERRTILSLKTNDLNFALN